MKILIIALSLSVMSFTHPFAQEGSVRNDDRILQERIEKARENEQQRELSREVLEEERQEQQEKEERFRIKEEELNEAEKLVE